MTQSEAKKKNRALRDWLIGTVLIISVAVARNRGAKSLWDGEYHSHCSLFILSQILALRPVTAAICEIVPNHPPKTGKLSSRLKVVNCVEANSPDRDILSIVASSLISLLEEKWSNSGSTEQGSFFGESLFSHQSFHARSAIGSRCESSAYFCCCMMSMIISCMEA